MTPAADNLRSIAFYLPQFHPIPENDQWWGAGFTDWTNVVKAKPLFPDHYQPHLPADLGFYDLRLGETREVQADLAQSYGIDAFCYYHYWFHGKQLLQRPFDEVLASRRPSLPFCLCWANEPWTRTWDGGTNQVLMNQHYSDDDDRRHIDWLLEAFADDRYVPVGGRPLFLVYRASHLPNPRKTTDLWRDRARSAGFPDLFLCKVENRMEKGDPGKMGFDAAVEFQPNSRVPLIRKGVRRRAVLRRAGMLRRDGARLFIDYQALVHEILAMPEPSYLRFPCVIPDWDNTARRPWAALGFTGSTPTIFGDWVHEVVRRLRVRPPDHQLLFVNAWNEWAEGCHLEPCQRWHHGYLEAFRKATG